MNRRRFLQFLGAAPAATALPGFAVVPAKIRLVETALPALFPPYIYRAEFIANFEDNQALLREVVGGRR